MQEEIFIGGEGDRWFERNYPGPAKLPNEEADAIIKMLATFCARPAKALEIGASNGERLLLLHKKFGCEAVAVEPSAAAIRDGATRFPEITFHQGVASALPLPDAAFDLVIFNGVLCWVDRLNLLRSAAEADRVLTPDGLLVIGDFLPPNPERVVYHHLPEANMYTYKQDYAAIFLSTHCYELLGRIVHCHADSRTRVDTPAHERFAVTLLRKEMATGYATKAKPQD